MMEALTSTPLLGLILTAAAFALARWFQKKTGWVLANPTVVSAAMIIALLLLLDIPYDDYARGGDFVNLMLSPVTAILALGIYNQRDILKRTLFRCWWAAPWAAPSVWAAYCCCAGSSVWTRRSPRPCCPRAAPRPSP